MVAFHFEREDITERSVTLTLLALYTDDECEALDEAHAWDEPCLPAFEVELELARWENPYLSIAAPSFYDLYDPGIRMEDFSPRNADRFQAQFDSKYGQRIRNALGPYLQQLKRGDHEERKRQRDNYFGRNQEPPQIPYQPQRRLPRK